MHTRNLFLSATLLTAFLFASIGCSSGNRGAGEEVISSGPKPGDYDYQEELTDFSATEVYNELIVHYKRNDDQGKRDIYKKWRLWMWNDGGSGNEYRPNGKDSYGGVYHYSLSELTGKDSGFENVKIGVIVKTLGNGTPWDGASKDIEADRFIVTSTLTADANGNYSVWLQNSISTVYASEPTTRDALGKVLLTDFQTFWVAASSGKYTRIDLYKDGVLAQEFPLETASSGKYFKMNEPAEITSTYSLKVTFESGYIAETELSTDPLFDTPEFKVQYDYDGELGAIYSKASTTFKVWSPLSDSITLRLYRSGTPKSVSSELGDDTVYYSGAMVKGEKGVFSLTINEDLDGFYYTYLVTNKSYKEKEIVDPYAKSSGINGLRGMIVDFSKTNPEGWDGISPNDIDHKALAVYEAHVADVTSHSSWGGDASKAKKFAGLIQKGTTHTSNGMTTKTGFDYIADLGVNAVQLLPIFDQANDEVNATFNWGYNPLNYNVVEGAYSSNPYDGAVRIKELKEVVAEFAKEGINVIMDVVYNHVNSVNGQNFDVLMPHYYFRYVDGALSNGSGCGNETASNRTMMRKFIVDSTSFWAKEYKLGGFRFDLMALVDLETMNQVAENVHAICPSAAIYGEPWTGGTSALADAEQAKQANGSKFQGYGQFNDGMRDALIKGGMKGVDEIGFVGLKEGLKDPSLASDISAIVGGLNGYTISSGTVKDADKTTNYVTCHDNYTLKDRFEAASKAINQAKGDGFLTYSNEELEGMNVLANSFVFASQGTSFMLEGEEMLRSKAGSHNSYGGDPLSPEMKEQGYSSWYEVNAIDYGLANEHASMVETYKKMIALKTSNPDFQQSVNKVSIVSSSDKQIVVDLVGAGKTYRMAFKNGNGDGEAVDFSGYTLDLNTSSSSVSLTASTKLSSYQTIIAHK